MWEDKPIGFGAVLTEYFHPNLRGIGYSMAAHSSGEWLYNFGFAGLIAMVLLLGLLLRALDNVLLQCGGGPLSATKFAVSGAVVVLVSEVPTLMWVGSFTYGTRAMQKLAVLFALAALYALVSRLVRGHHPRERSIASSQSRLPAMTGAKR